MAITVTERYANESLAQTSTTAFSPTSNITAGSTLILLAAGGVIASKTVSSVSDSVGGNTWTVDATAVEPTNQFNVSIVRCTVVNAITTAATITVTWGAAGSSAVQISLQEIANLAASPFDKTAVGNASNNTPTTASSGTLSQAYELVIVGMRPGDGTGYAHGTGFTDATTPIITAATKRFGIEYKIVNATTAVTGPSTITNAGVNTTLLATYKGAAPVNTVAPAVTGTTAVGSVLTTTNGTWTDDGSPAFTYQWQRDAFGNSSYSNIGSATSSTYTLVDADDGCHVRCNVTDTGGAGATTQASNAVGLIVEAAVPANTVAPVASGSTTVGSTVSSTTGTWTGMGGHTATFAYQWQRDVLGNGVYSNIGSATSSSYVLVILDDGCNVRCTVTATNDVGAGTPTNSNSILDTTPPPSSGGTQIYRTLLGAG